MRLCPDSNVIFRPEHIGGFNVQNSGCPGILNAEASSLQLFMYEITDSRPTAYRSLHLVSLVF